MRIFIFTAALFSVPAIASAHFPYIHLEESGNDRTLHAYFGHGVAKTDKKYFNRLDGANVARIDANGKAQSLSLAPADGSLASRSVPAGEAAFVFEKDQGVVSHNGTYQLTNYSKAFTSPEAWSIDTSKRLKLDIAPERDGEELTLTVRWKGKKIADTNVVVELGSEKQEGKTDAEGRFSAKLAKPGLYAVRTWRIEETPGQRDGRKYDDVRYYSTLILDVK